MKPITLNITIQSNIYTHYTNKNINQHINIQKKTTILYTTI